MFFIAVADNRVKTWWEEKLYFLYFSFFYYKKTPVYIFFFNFFELTLEKAIYPW